MMNSAATGEADEICASCGIPACDDITLKNCTACYLVKYCSIKCQRNHRPQHKRACKKRAAELRDELLFKQPDGTHLGDCPICFIPIPIDKGISQNKTLHTVSHLCCNKLVCKGCAYETRLHQKEKTLEKKCPFCRTPYPEDDAEVDRLLKNRIAANDPVAIGAIAGRCWREGNISDAFKYATQAAKLGDVEANQQIAIMYMDGEGVEKDMEKALYHLEEAAIGGHPSARAMAGIVERSRGRHERAVKHFVIAANQGLDFAVDQLKECYGKGYVRKDDFAEALRAHQRAVDATKSPQREAAKRNPDLLNLKMTE